MTPEQISEAQARLRPLPAAPRERREYRRVARWWELEAERGYVGVIHNGTTSSDRSRRYAQNMRWAAGTRRHLRARHMARADRARGREEPGGRAVRAAAVRPTACGVCGTPIAQPPRGGLRLWCSDACRLAGPATEGARRRRSPRPVRPGQHFGRLLVERVEFRPNPHKPGRLRFAICKCDCGKRDHTVVGATLRSGNTNSCGCLRQENAIRRAARLQAIDLRRAWYGPGLAQAGGTTT